MRCIIGMSTPTPASLHCVGRSVDIRDFVPPRVSCKVPFPKGNQPVFFAATLKGRCEFIDYLSQIRHAPTSAWLEWYFLTTAAKIFTVRKSKCSRAANDILRQDVVLAVEKRKVYPYPTSVSLAITSSIDVI
ncbi:unnamed protein product [Nesidiocoris tenuis]|uniref:Uncharacterized protein n=1 Tax=Nesidiocoris tenuis TaxID=355587 RepID=A0A6H5HPS5_9HEMI|nr:unnamed protein product [Nesidiocoris tenuis]